MKRDWDLVRKALLALEEGTGPMKEDEPEMIYAYQILDDGGYVKVAAAPMSGNGHVMYIVVLRLTWDGHELLNSIREETTWNKVKNRIGDHLTTITVEVLKAVAVEITKSSLNLH